LTLEKNIQQSVKHTSLWRKIINHEKVFLGSVLLPVFLSLSLSLRKNKMKNGNVLNGSTPFGQKPLGRQTFDRQNIKLTIQTINCSVIHRYKCQKPNIELAKCLSAN
jgi:hypothetical protein